MRRNYLSSTTLSTIIAAALLPAGSLWAANAGNSTAHELSQVGEQAYQIQVQADRLEGYLRSGAHDWGNSAGFLRDMNEEAVRLWSLLDQVATQPGATNDTRLQVKKMKNMTGELMAFTGDALRDLDPHAMALRVNSIFASTANIEERCDMIRSAAQTLADTH